MKRQSSMREHVISILLPSLQIGGAEMSLVELANSLADDGWRIHLLVMSKDGPLIEKISPFVELVDLRCASYKKAVLVLARYYKRRRPAIILTSLYATGLAAVAARLISQGRPKILIGAHNSLQAKVDRPDNAKDRWLLMPMCRLLFPLADGFVPVSKGLAGELETLLHLPIKKIHPIYNPVVNSGLEKLSTEPVSHPWLTDRETCSYKCLVSVGRLVEQKGYDILLRALLLARREIDCRLIIVGGGPLLPELENIAQQLGIRDVVDFVGWQTNPYKFISRADLFVLSSRWEGLANVLIEALACGCSVVSTNCKYGPEEILEEGRYGALANVDDPVDLSEKIISSLKHTDRQSSGKSARFGRAQEFTVTASTQQYAAYFSEILAGTVAMQQVRP